MFRFKMIGYFSQNKTLITAKPLQYRLHVTNMLTCGVLYHVYGTMKYQIIYGFFLEPVDGVKMELSLRRPLVGWSTVEHQLSTEDADLGESDTATMQIDLQSVKKK